MSITTFKTPLGVINRAIPKSGMADQRTSKELIADLENDAFYFRLLEKQGVLLNAEQIEAT
ncbi:hypothetical protein [Tepidibacillus marianensis]|uniref:hypothetical protein n=1 Tax=Tepidibacillus marianensis TaxID=3131995 RepID=UPI0030CE899A